MKNTELKKPEKDQTYLIYVRFSDYYKAKNYRSEFSYFSVFNVTKLISGLTHSTFKKLAETVHVHIY